MTDNRYKSMICTHALHAYPNGGKQPNQRFGNKLSLFPKAFLNENKGQYFSNLQDSLLAYFQGRLQTHTPFWVRIDQKFAREKVQIEDLYPNDQLHSNGGYTVPNSSLSQLRDSLLIQKKSSICTVNTTHNSLTQPHASHASQPNQRTAIVKIASQANPRAIARGSETSQANTINSRLCDTKTGRSSPASFREIMLGNQIRLRMLRNQTEDLSDLQKARGSETSRRGYRTLLPKVRELLAVSQEKEKLNNFRDLTEANPHCREIMLRNPNMDNFKALKLKFLQPLYGSSQEISQTLFQNKSANNFQIHVEANETLESPLELRLNVDGNLANILTMFQNHYNYNATWVKQCKEESIKYMRTTAGRVVINDVVFKDF